MADSPTPFIITDTDVRDPSLLLRALRKVADRIGTLGTRVSKIETTPIAPTVPAIKQALQATGAAPLNVTGLLGVLAQPQPANVTAYTASPTGQVLQGLRDGQLVVVVSTSTGDTLYRVVGGNPNTLTQINPAVAGASIVTVKDDNFTIQDDADATKQSRFELSSITAGQTRIQTIPDTAQILAGRNVDNSFSSDETFNNNLGIGAAPAAGIDLDINRAAATATARVRGTTSAAVAIDHTTANSSSNIVMRQAGVDKFFIGTGVYTADVTNLDLGNASASLLRVTSTGNIGIGTNNPTVVGSSTGLLGTFTNTKAAITARLVAEGTTAANLHLVATSNSAGKKHYQLQNSADVLSLFANDDTTPLPTATQILQITSTGDQQIAGKVTNYNTITTAGLGLPVIVASVVLTGRSTSIGATNLLAAAAAGMYRGSLYIDTSATGSVGTVTATLGWNDGDSAESVTTSSVSLTAIAGSFATLDQPIKSGAAQAITYSTTVTGAVGSPLYALSVVLERLT